mmetsp:Transcript_137160/g.242475  ORF Transcript_137160/g.242475 Transcript_137160/m.242475 type:complete len:392 (+) Transcript_137160:113-1288(+)
MVNPGGRRTVAGGPPRSTRLSRGTAGSGGRSSFRDKGGRRSAGGTDVEMPKYFAEQPSCLRFIELGLAFVLWAVACVFLLFFPHQLVASLVIVFAMVCLVLHSQLLRPYCYEFDEEEDALFGADLNDDAAENAVENGNPNARRMFGELGQQFWEEWKLVLLCVLIMGSIGCVVSWTRGGAFAFQTWIAPKHAPCDVANLPEAHSGGNKKFSCQDGYLDVEGQVSLMKKVGILMPSYNTYRMAPVYSERPKDGDLPVAWAVSFNLHMNPARPMNGASGIFVSLDEDPSICQSLLCIARQDQTAYLELRHLLEDTIQKDVDDEFDAAKLPAVVLTDLRNPIGKTFHFLSGAACYLVVMICLCCVTTSMVMEHRRSAEKKLAEEPQYDLLNEND